METMSHPLEPTTSGGPSVTLQVQDHVDRILIPPSENNNPVVEPEEISIVPPERGNHDNPEVEELRTAIDETRGLISTSAEHTLTVPAENTILEVEPEEMSTVPAGKQLCRNSTSRRPQRAGKPDDAELVRLRTAINEMIGLPPRPANNGRRFDNMYFRPGEFFGNPLMGTLSQALYGDWNARNNGHIHRISDIETWYYVKYMVISNPLSAEDAVERIRCLVEYLERADGNLRVADFARFVRGTSIWTRDKEFEDAWYLFYLILGFPHWLPLYDSFDESIGILYPRSASGYQRFTTTLDDILAVELAVVPTAFTQEHLSVDEDTVKIYKPTIGGLYQMYHYGSNRVAKVLQIEALGAEIACSLYNLYGRTPRLLDKARELHIFPEGEDCEQLLCLILFPRFESTTVNNLANNVGKLRDVIAQRRSWWPSLKRDIHRYRRQQPWLFWGSIFAIAFGICAVIQTVASVVSCYYAIITYKATLASLPVPP